MARAAAAAKRSADDADVLARRFRGFGDPTRLRILELLRAGPCSVGELVAATKQPQPKVSNHLASLRACGLVRNERRGRRVYYRLADRRVAQMLDVARRLPGLM